MNKKGQALVEFIIVMPIFIMILLSSFDIVKIIQTKMNLESLIEDVILDDKTSLDKDVNLIKEQKDNLITYYLTKKVPMTSPFVTMVTNEYEVTIERTIYAK